MAWLEDLLALKPFLGLWRREARSLGLGLGLVLLTAFAGLGLLGLSGSFLAACAVAASQALPGFNLVLPSGWIRLLALARTLGRYGERLVSHDATFRLLGTLRSWLWSALAGMPAPGLWRLHGAELLERFMKDIDSLDHLYLRVVLPGLGACLALLPLLGIAAWAAGGAGLGFLLAAVLLCLVQALLLPALAFGNGRRFAAAVLEHQQALRRGLVELVDDLEELSLHKPAWLRHRTGIQMSDAARAEQIRRSQARSSLLRAASACLGSGVVLLVLAALAARPDFDPLLAVGLVAAFGALGEMVSGLAPAMHELAQVAASARNLQAVLGNPIVPKRNAASASGPSGATSAPRAQASLEIRGLSFAWPDQPPLFSGLDLVLEPGAHLALHGPSGVGKSTLLELIAGMHRFKEGQILIDGHRLGDLPESSLRRLVCLVPQAPWIMQGSLAENLRLADPEADETRLWSVLEALGLAGRFRSSGGLASWIEEGGANLSGGQRQRIGLARALLRDSPILLLDEAAEGLSLGEATEILQRVRLARRGRSLIWVSHQEQQLAGFERCLRLAGQGGLD